MGRSSNTGLMSGTEMSTLMRKKQKYELKGNLCEGKVWWNWVDGTRNILWIDCEISENVIRNDQQSNKIFF